jgi:glycine/D-amino acid oxidase-like deaminating enzyme
MKYGRGSCLSVRTTRRADVVIIGGGLLGTATAYYAATAGMSVVLLEERDLAAGASGAAFGGVSSMVFSYSDTRVPDYYVKLSLASVRLYTELAEELGPPLDYKVIGQIDPFFDDADRPFREERVAGLRESGSPVELLSADALRKIEPALSGDLAGGMWCPTDGHVTPLCAVWALADGARRHGAEIRLGVRADRILVEGGRAVGVATSHGDVGADWVITCGGAGTAALADTVGLKIPLDYGRGQMLVTERIPRLLRTSLHNMQQTVAGTIVIGVTREPEAEDVRTTPAGTRQILKSAVRLVPALAGVRVLRTWAGVRIVPAGGYPVFGPVDGVEGLLICVMHRGVTLGPIVGKILAEIASTGSTTWDIAPYAASRFGGTPAEADVPETFYASH